MRSANATRPKRNHSQALKKSLLRHLLHGSLTRMKRVDTISHQRKNERWKEKNGVIHWSSKFFLRYLPCNNWENLGYRNFILKHLEESTALDFDSIGSIRVSIRYSHSNARLNKKNMQILKKTINFNVAKACNSFP